MKSIPRNLLLVLTIGILAIISFSSGCTEQGKNSSGPSGNTSQQLETISTDKIINTEWQWAGFQQSNNTEKKTTVHDPKNYTLAFFSDGTYYIKADCNSGSGNYILEGNSLTLGPATITLMACGPDSMDSEYLALLSYVQSAALENGKLLLFSQNAGDRMFFNNGGRAEQKA
jgi:heat shock protein HslJ